MDAQRIGRVGGSDAHVCRRVPPVHQPKPSAPGCHLLRRHLGSEFVERIDGQHSTCLGALPWIGLRHDAQGEGMIAGGALRLTRRAEGQGRQTLFAGNQAQWFAGQCEPGRRKPFHAHTEVVYLHTLVEDAQATDGLLPRIDRQGLWLQETDMPSPGNAEVEGHGQC